MNIPSPSMTGGWDRNVGETRRTFWLTEDHTVRYARKQDKGNLFIKVTTILPLSGLVGDHPGSSPSQGDSAETAFQGKRLENRETAA